VEPLDEAVSALPLLMGADGVMVPFRPEGGKDLTVWREVKVAVLARLGRRSRSNAPQLHQRRLVAVLLSERFSKSHREIMSNEENP
jgi:hypothetical protein